MTQPGVWTRSVRTSQEDAEIVIAKNGDATALSFPSALQAARIDASASGLVIRRPRGAHRVLTGAWNLTQYRENDLQLRTAAPATLVIVQQSDHRAILNAGSVPVSLLLERPVAVTVTLAPSTALRIDATGEHPMKDLSDFRMPEEADLPSVANSH